MPCARTNKDERAGSEDLVRREICCYKGKLVRATYWPSAVVSKGLSLRSLHVVIIFLFLSRALLFFSLSP